MGLHSGIREVQLEANMYGEKTSHDMIVEHLQNVKDDLTWEMTGGDIVMPDTVLDEPGDRVAEAEEAVMTTENVFYAGGIRFE